MLNAGRRYDRNRRPGRAVAGPTYGAFAFQQFGILYDGGQDMRYEIVPGSGTDQLAGISGTLELEVVAGEHRYQLMDDLG